MICNLYGEMFLNLFSWNIPSPDYDREDLDLYELADNCLEKKDFLKNDFLKQLKYK